MRANQSLTGMSSLLLSKLDEIEDKIKADIILVQGDTTSAFIAGLWGFLKGKKVAHIEAGLRTNNIRSPFPEEANRQLLSKISDFHFAPTEDAKSTLLKEGIRPEFIFNVGNTSIDALLIVKDKIETNQIPHEFKISTDVTDFISDKKFVLVTGHRRENFGAGLEGICKGIKLIAEKRPDCRIIYPVHFNPQVREKVMSLLPSINNVKLIGPLNYVSFVQLMKRADVILTDSGGVQEEAPTFSRPVVVMRENTERPEGVKAGLAVLAGTDPEKICNEVLKCLDGNKKITGINPFGDGKAGRRIVEILANNA